MEDFLICALAELFSDAIFEIAAELVFGTGIRLGVSSAKQFPP